MYENHPMNLSQTKQFKPNEDSSVEGEAMTHLMRLDTKLRSGEVAQQCDSVVRFSELITKYPLPVIVSTALLKLADLFKNW